MPEFLGPDDFKRLKSAKNIEELNEIFKTLNVPEEFSLHNAYCNVLVLIELIDFVNKNGSQLTNPVSVMHVKNKIKPGTFLGDYIILEISNYYSKIHKMRRDGVSLPEPPSDWEILKNYRNLGPGHRDVKHEMKNLLDYKNAAMSVNNLGNMVNNFLEYHKKFRKIGNQNDLP